jgi:hypothetical protein
MLSHLSVLPSLLAVFGGNGGGVTSSLSRAASPGSGRKRLRVVHSSRRRGVARASRVSPWQQFL